MDRLPELQRQTLILFAEQDLSHAEVAAAMDTDVNTVKSRLFQARKNLRRRLAPDIRLALGLWKEKENTDGGK